MTESDVTALDETGMRRAIEAARAGLDAGELPIGAVVMSGDRVVSRACTAENATGRLVVHGDLLALIAADEPRPTVAERRRMTLYVTVEPCMMCLGAAMTAFIGRVVYALESPSDGAVRLAAGLGGATEFPAYRLPEIRAGVLRHEVPPLFAEYARRYPERKGMTTWAESLAALGDSTPP